jgi:sugar lactone lactonase YvrE
MTPVSNAPRSSSTGPRRPSMLLLVGLSLLGAVGAFLLWPSPISATARRIGVPMPTLPSNDALRQVELIGEGRINNPEDIAFDAQGRLYVGSRDSTATNLVVGIGDANPRIERVIFLPDGSQRLEEWVKLPGGGPLDMRFDANGNLIVASWGQGLVSISPEKRVEVLVPDGQIIEGTPFGYADGVAIHSDGRIFFTQGTNGSYSGTRVVQDVLSGRGFGRLLEYNPSTKQTRVLISDLSFGNGVALAPDQSYVLVADQLRYTIKRYWLTGDRAGTEDIWADNLPGFVHNIFLDKYNTLWLAFNQGRNPIVDRLSNQPWLREQIAKLPASFFNRAPSRDETQRARGFVLAMTLDGRVLESYQNPPQKLDTLSTAVYHDGYLYMGTLTGGPVIRHKLERHPGRP